MPYETKASPRFQCSSWNSDDALRNRRDFYDRTRRHFKQSAPEPGPGPRTHRATGTATTRTQFSTRGHAHGTLHVSTGSSRTRRLTAAIVFASEELPRPPKPSPEWFILAGPELRALIDARNDACRLFCSLRHADPGFRDAQKRLREARCLVKGAVDNAKNEWLVRRYLDLNDDTDGRSGGKSFWQTVVDLKRGLRKLPHKPPRPSKNLMGPFAEPTPRLQTPSPPSSVNFIVPPARATTPYLTFSVLPLWLSTSIPHLQGRKSSRFFALSSLEKPPEPPGSPLTPGSPLALSTTPYFTGNVLGFICRRTQANHLQTCTGHELYEFSPKR